ncbi:MAG: hypothetical protein WAU58_15680 [Terriglobales bacterium]
MGDEAELVADELAVGLAAGLLERVGCVCAQTIAVCAMKMPDNTRTNWERWVLVIRNSIVTEPARIVISADLNSPNTVSLPPPNGNPIANHAPEGTLREENSALQKRQRANID